MKYSKNISTMTVSLCTVAVMLVSIKPAYAIFAKLTTDLVGQYSLNGATSNGKAAIDQAKYPTKPVVLYISVDNVRLPDGAVMPVTLTDCPWYGPVAYLKIVSYRASLTTSLPSVCQIGRASAILVNAPDGSTLLKGGSSWKI